MIAGERLFGHEKGCIYGMRMQQKKGKSKWQTKALFP